MQIPFSPSSPPQFVFLPLLSCCWKSHLNADPDLLIDQILTVPSSVCFNLCLAPLFPHWVSFAQLCMETRSQGKKETPVQPKPGREKSRAHVQTEEALVWMSLPYHLQTPREKRFPKMRTDYICSQKSLLAMSLQSFMACSTRLIQSRNTLPYVRWEFATQLDSHQKAQKSLLYTDYLFIYFEGGFFELYLLCLSSHSSKWCKGAGQNDVQSGGVHH